MAAEMNDSKKLPQKHVAWSMLKRNKCLVVQTREKMFPGIPDTLSVHFIRYEQFSDS